MNIYLVRHCKAEGQSPEAGLTEIGYVQAARLAEVLSDKKIEAIISSPFVRAYQSIIPLAERLNIDVITDGRLSERILSGENHTNWREMLRSTFHDLDLCHAGGESSKTAMSRAISVINDVLMSGVNNAVLTTHGNLLSLMLKYYDHSFGFDDWEALTNPDVYHLSFAGDSPVISRIWTE